MRTSVVGMTSWDDITAAIATAVGGDRETGRRELLGCWVGLDPAQHAERCVVAHYLADVQDDLDDEVAWDERALTEHALIDRHDLAVIGIASAASLAPSLHLNLGDGYLRQGRVVDARLQLEAGRDAEGALGNSGYATLISGGLDGLQARLEAYQ